MARLSNKELAERYLDKQRLLGINILDFTIIDDNSVVLENVLDTNDDGRLEIPSFITRILGGCLQDCKYSEIYINNSGEHELNLSGLCMGMASTKLKVNCRYSACIIDMSYMFYCCEDLKEVDISGLDTSKVNDMECMFKCCKNLEHIRYNLTTNNVKNIGEMFSFCERLKDVDISNWDTSKVEYMHWLFYGCIELGRVGLYG